ncbi:MAG: FAD-dependent oxidoreductase, partial [Spirulina sp. DLM2.Bin59]
MTLAAPPVLDVAIIGAGPHGLTLATHLLKKKPQWRSRLAIFDPQGQWLTQWRHQFRALDIPYLRSPAVHHPDPDPYALRRFATGRSHELHPPYDRPGRELFNQFCEDVVARWQLEAAITPAAITALEPVGKSRTPRLRLHDDQGGSVVARQVVLAL